MWTSENQEPKACPEIPRPLQHYQPALYAAGFRQRYQIRECLTPPPVDQLPSALQGLTPHAVHLGQFPEESRSSLEECRVATVAEWPKAPAA